MVKPYTSLLALTLATASALASSDSYQRRSELHDELVGREPHLHNIRYGLAASYGQGHMQSRALADEEELLERELHPFDDLEAREPLGIVEAFKIASKVGKQIDKHERTINRVGNVANTVSQVKQAVHSRGLEDDEELFGRDFDDEELFGREYDLLDERDTFDDFELQSRDLADEEQLLERELDPFDDLEAREPFGFEEAFKMAAKVESKIHRHSKTIRRAGRVANGVNQAQQLVQSRGFEDDEELFGRDFDDEELFGREYDLLEERDTFDDLD